MSPGAGTPRGTAATAEERRRERIALLALGVILSTALALRVLGVSFGLPAVYNPDEVAIMSRALAFAQGDLNPHNFVYPTLYFYVLFGWIGAYFAGGWFVGVFPSVSAFQQRFFVDPTGVFLAGRFLSVLLGVAGVFVTYRLARRAFGRPAGLAAAAFLATAPFHVRDSHYVKHDIPATFAIAAAILAIMWFADTPRDSEARTRRLVWASALSGVAFSIHYYAVFLAAPLLLAISVSGETRPRTLLRHVVLSGGIALAVFFVCSPFLLVEPGTALNDIVANRRIVVDRAVRTSAGAFPYLGTYAGMLWEDAIGRTIVVLAGVGGVACAASSWRLALILAAFPIAFFAFVTHTVPATRYLTPILPVVAVLAGHGAAWPLSRLSRARGAATTGLVAVALLGPLADSARAGRFFSQTDTRTLALRFVETRVPAGASIAVQPYSVPVIQSRESLLESLSANIGDKGRVPAKVAIRLALTPYPQPAYRLIYLGDGGLDQDKIYVGYRRFEEGHGLQALRDLGVGYVLLKRPAPGDANVRRLAAALGEEADRLALFAPFDHPDTCGDRCPEPFFHNANARIDPRLHRPGPVIEVWRIRSRD